MAVVTPEIFKLWPEEDQDALIGTIQDSVDELVAEQSNHQIAIQQLDADITRYSNSLSGDPNASVAQQINSNHAGQYGGDLKDLIQAAQGTAQLTAAESEKAKHEERLANINTQLEPQQAQLALLNKRNEDLDNESLKTELSDLYKAQQKNYEAYLENEAVVERRQNTVNSMNRILFANHSKFENELKEAQQRSALIAVEFASNMEMLGKAAEFLTDEELKPFMELANKMAAAVNKGEEEQPPESPEMLTNKPIETYFITTSEKMTCPFASGGQAVFVANLSRKAIVTNNQMGNIMDFQPMVNILSFGLCSSMLNPQVAAATSAAMGALTPQPCVPNVVTPWTPGKVDLLVENAPALLNTDTCQCMWGGTISFVPKPPEPPASSEMVADGDDMSDAITTIENLLTENGVKLGGLAKGLKVAGSVLTAGIIAYDFFSADKSGYAQSLADAQKKHSGKIDSIDELGARGGDYLGGALKEIGLPDGFADTVNFAVRESIQTISAPGELTYELGKAIGLDSVGESIGSWLAEKVPPPEWLLDIF